MNFAALCKNGGIHAVDPGVYLNMPREQYDRIPALSATVLKRWLALREIPSEFSWWLKTRWKDEGKSEWLLIGSALDCLLLEPDQFNLRYALIPADAPRRPNKAQRRAKNPSAESAGAIAWWHEFEAISRGKMMLEASQYETVCKMRDAVVASPLCEKIFEHCQKVVLVNELWGFSCKAEIDLWHPQTEHLMDLKSAYNIEPAEFEYAARRYGYLEQATFYLLLAQNSGFDFKRIFSFIGVKSAEPWTVKVRSFAPYRRDDHKLVFQSISERLRKGAFELSDRLLDNNFSDSEDWGMMDFPAWYLREKSLALY